MTLRTIERMVAGFRSFKSIYYEQRPERVSGLVEGQQKPEVVLIACSDSRVDPAILMNAEPGELFVIRNVAALVPPYAPDNSYHGTSAALEYAVRHLNVVDAVVLGHSGCGGVQALVKASQEQTIIEPEEPPTEHSFIGPWMSMMSDAVQATRTQSDEDLNADLVSQETLRQSVANLRSFPFVRAACEAGYLRLHGWWFNMQEGTLYRLDEATGTLSNIA